jgi:hypothetical protein
VRESNDGKSLAARAWRSRSQTCPRLLDDLARRSIDGRADIAFPALVAHASAPELTATVHPLGTWSGRVTIGRAPEMDVCLGDETISRHHATLELHGLAWFLMDEGSTNGTFKFEVPLAHGVAVELSPGDRIRLGPRLCCAILDARGLADLVRARAAALQGLALDSTPLGHAKIDTRPTARETIRRSYPEQLVSDLLAAAIIRRVRELPFVARRYSVVLEDELVEVLESASELEPFIFENLTRVVQVEARPSHGGATRIIWRRAGLLVRARREEETQEGA